MAIREIPTRTDLQVYRFTIELDQVIFALLMWYNERSGHWFFNLSDIDGVPLREGIKMVCNWPLTQSWIQQGRPDGEFICANPENDNDPDDDTLGTSAVFVYDEGGAFG